MNKLCPICKKRVTKKQPHLFIDGQRYHKLCYENDDCDDKVMILRSRQGGKNTMAELYNKRRREE